MSWYKQAQASQALEERNRLNRNIRELEAVMDRLRYAAKLVYQTQRGARDFVEEVSGEKVLSSYPIITEALFVANETALDSPQKFAEACYASIEEIQYRIDKLRKQRKDVMDPNSMKKGLF